MRGQVREQEWIVLHDTCRNALLMADGDILDWKKIHDRPGIKVVAVLVAGDKVPDRDSFDAVVSELCGP